MTLGTRQDSIAHWMKQCTQKSSAPEASKQLAALLSTALPMGNGDPVDAWLAQWLPAFTEILRHATEHQIFMLDAYVAPKIIRIRPSLVYSICHAIGSQLERDSVNDCVALLFVRQGALQMARFDLHRLPERYRNFQGCFSNLLVHPIETYRLASFHSLVTIHCTWDDCHYRYFVDFCRHAAEDTNGFRAVAIPLIRKFIDRAPAGELLRDFDRIAIDMASVMYEYGSIAVGVACLEALVLRNDISTDAKSRCYKTLARQLESPFETIRDKCFSVLLEQQNLTNCFAVDGVDGQQLISAACLTSKINEADAAVKRLLLRSHASGEPLSQFVHFALNQVKVQLARGDCLQVGCVVALEALVRHSNDTLTQGVYESSESVLLVISGLLQTIDTVDKAAADTLWYAILYASKIMVAYASRNLKTLVTVGSRLIDAMLNIRQWGAIKALDGSFRQLCRLIKSTPGEIAETTTCTWNSRILSALTTGAVKITRIDGKHSGVVCAIQSVISAQSSPKQRERTLGLYLNTLAVGVDRSEDWLCDVFRLRCLLVGGQIIDSNAVLHNDVADAIIFGFQHQSALVRAAAGQLLIAAENRLRVDVRMLDHFVSQLRELMEQIKRLPNRASSAFAIIQFVTAANRCSSVQRPIQLSHLLKSFLSHSDWQIRLKVAEVIVDSSTPTEAIALCQELLPVRHQGNADRSCSADFNFIHGLICVLRRCSTKSSSLRCKVLQCTSDLNALWCSWGLEVWPPILMLSLLELSVHVADHTQLDFVDELRRNVKLYVELNPSSRDILLQAATTLECAAHVMKDRILKDQCFGANFYQGFIDAHHMFSNAQQRAVERHLRERLEAASVGSDPEIFSAIVDGLSIFLAPDSALSQLSTTRTVLDFVLPIHRTRQVARAVRSAARFVATHAARVLDQLSVHQQALALDLVALLALTENAIDGIKFCEAIAPLCSDMNEGLKTSVLNIVARYLEEDDEYEDQVRVLAANVISLLLHRKSGCLSIPAARLKAREYLLQ